MVRAGTKIAYLRKFQVWLTNQTLADFKQQRGLQNGTYVFTQPGQKRTFAFSAKLRAIHYPNLEVGYHNNSLATGQGTRQCRNPGYTDISFLDITTTY